jgi:heme/copper-type cytochrome/quinol oxidase subunit 2
MAKGPSEKPLQTASFSVHVTRGLIRDPRTRRITMGVLLTLAVAMIVAGSTLLEHWLAQHGHLLWFMLFWAVCGWLTVTALLLAVFDILLLRMQAREERKAFRSNLEGD